MSAVFAFNLFMVCTTGQAIEIETNGIGQQVTGYTVSGCTALWQNIAYPPGTAVFECGEFLSARPSSTRTVFEFDDCWLVEVDEVFWDGFENG